MARPDPLTSNVRSLDVVQRLGGILSRSGFFSDARGEAQCCTKILAGRELGLGPVASIVGIYFVKGRLSLSANTMASVILKSGLARYRTTQHTKDSCTLLFQRREAPGQPWEDVGESSFSMEDAKLAGLASGDNWRKYSRNMLFARALTNGAKWFCPDLFSGQTPYLPDEIAPDHVHYDADNNVIIDAEVLTTGDRQADAATVEASLTEPDEAVFEEADPELVELIHKTSADVGLILKHTKCSTLGQLSENALTTVKNNLRAKLALQEPLEATLS